MDNDDILLTFIGILLCLLGILAVMMTLLTAQAYGITFDVDIQAEADKLSEFIRTHWWIFAIGTVCAVPIYLYSRWIQYRQNEAQMRIMEKAVRQWWENDGHDKD